MKTQYLAAHYNKSQGAKKFIAKLIAIYIIVFVFEETVYGHLNLDGVAYLVAKTATEVFLYIFLILLILHRLNSGSLLRYRITRFDFYIFAFITFAFISTFFNDGSILQGAINIRTMLRYMAIYYIIILINWAPSEQQVLRFLKLLVSIALFQSILIAIQHIAGDDFRDTYFAPPQGETIIAGINTIYGTVASKIGAGYGTFGKTPLAAFYLLFVAVITIAVALSQPQKDAKKWWLAYIIILVGIYFSYKRAPLLIAFIAPILVAWIINRRRLAIRYAAILSMLIPFALILLLSVKLSNYVKEKEVEVSPIESIAQLFSEEYWSISLAKSRGWMITEVGQQVFASFKFLGYGADEDHTKASLATIGGEFSKLVGWGAFDDVYIIATLVYYGPIGISLLMMAFYSIYCQGKKLAIYSPNPFYRAIGASLTTIIIVSLISIFVVRLPEFRPFCFSLLGNRGHLYYCI